MSLLLLRWFHRLVGVAAVAGCVGFTAPILGAAEVDFNRDVPSADLLAETVNGAIKYELVGGGGWDTGTTTFNLHAYDRVRRLKSPILCIKMRPVLRAYWRAYWRTFLLFRLFFYFRHS